MTYKGNKKIAIDRIENLFIEARKAAINDNIKKANRYVELARKIGMRYNVSIPSRYKRRFCKNCYSYLEPSKTNRIRINKGKIISRCNNCGYINRFKFKDR